MRPVIITILFCCGSLISCYKPYSASIDADEKILVVEGLITNEVASYHINLSYAQAFYTKGVREPVTYATVTVTDNDGLYYPFREMNAGHYVSDSLKFKGKPGNSYILSITTSDGERYSSDQQQLSASFSPERIYAEPGTRESLSSFSGQVELTEGASIMIDVKSSGSSHFGYRFKADMVKQYFYTRPIPPPNFDPPLYLFYCWQTDEGIYDINITTKGYPSGSSFLISRQEVYFLADQYFINGSLYDLGSLLPDGTYSSIPTENHATNVIKHRILYLDQYALNEDSYFYYKSLDEQLRSDGKLFDPIAVQLDCNINCLTNHSKRVFGFFEASSVSHTSYIIGFRKAGDVPYTIKKIPWARLPRPNGCLINGAPPFWIN